MQVFHDLQEYIQTLSFEQIAEERRSQLTELAGFMQNMEGALPALLFICTHNSRRSQLAQAWALALADFHDLPIRSYSGGTEKTDFYSTAISTLEKAGFEISPLAGKQYRLKWSSRDGVIMSSKLYDARENPHQHFVAMMTCSQASEACPHVAGALRRFAFNFEDPKVADGTDEEASRYEERSRQIASEIHYLFSKITA